MATYAAITRDNEVEKLEEILIEEIVQVEQKERYTLQQLDNRIADIDVHIAKLTADRAALISLRETVHKEASKIVLKAEEPTLAEEAIIK